jgi:hypothetical protein
MQVDLLLLPHSEKSQASTLNGTVPLDALFEDGTIDGEIPLSDENGAFMCTLNAIMRL